MGFQGACINLALNNLYEERRKLFAVGHYKVISVVLKEVSSCRKPGPFVPLQVRMGLCYGDHVVNAEAENIFVSAVHANVVWPLKRSLQLP